MRTLIKAETDVVKAHMSVLLIKNEIELDTPFTEIQQLLFSRFNIECSLEDIEGTLLELTHEDDVLELEEDLIEGW